MTTSQLADNPFAEASPLPFGLPPFETIEERHYLPAFEAGMAEQLAEIDAIAADPRPPTWANTLDALEASGQLLGRVSAVFFNVISSCSTPGLERIEATVAPLLAAHHDAIHLDPRLWARIAELRADDAADAEQRRLLWRYRLDFQRSGAELDQAGQQRLREINTELSSATTTFRSRLLADTAARAVLVQTEAELEGLSPDAVSAAAAAAAERGLSGYLLTLVLPTDQPALAVLKDRAVRERLHRASVARGLDGECETRSVLTGIATLRAERAALFGYPHHAGYVTADQTAGSLEAVEDLLTRLVGAAVTNAQREHEQSAAAMAADGVPGPLQPWDWAYYAARVEADRHRVDPAAVRDYFELGRVSEAVMWAAGQLYGLTFTRRTDLRGYLPDVEVYEVGRDGSPVGLVLADWYARAGKKGGAWMSTFVDQSRLLSRSTVAVLNLNIARPSQGPTLLTVDEVNTAFHEFGHVLHALLSDVTYPRFSGTNVPRDFVEFPSQLNEIWARDPQVLSRYARHHATGEPLPTELATALNESRSSGQGFATVSYLAATVLDLAWHRLPAGAQLPAADVEAFEADALAAAGLALDAVPPRYRSAYFAHIFAGGYSAGYYSYIWSEVLDADLVDWFADNGGLSRRSGDLVADRLLSRGGSVDPMAAFTSVRGRGPDVGPLLRRRRLT